METDVPIGPPVDAQPAGHRRRCRGLRPDTGRRNLPIPSGAVNGVARLATDAGEVVVRVHRPWTTAARLEAVHAVCASLRAAGLPLPRILRVRDGTTSTWLADRLVEVAEYVPHTHTADTWGRGAAAFAMLARLHAALDTLPPGLVPPPYSSYATPDEAVAMLDETETAFTALVTHPRYAEAAAVRGTARALLLHLAAARREYEAQLPRGLAHGDYGGDNVLLGGDRVVALLDFDFLGERERLADLAYALYWALDRYGFAFPAMPTDVALAHAAGLLAQYEHHTARPLTPAERAALPLELARVPLYWVAEAGYLPADAAHAGPLDQTLRFARHVSRATQIVAAAERVAQLLADPPTANSRP